MDFPKEDLTEYSNDELSLQVFNTEELYKIRHKRNFTDVIKQLFIFTDEQLETLIQDLKDDENE